MLKGFLLLAIAVASSSAAKGNTQPKVFGLDFKKAKREPTNSLARRQNSVAAGISNEQIFYQINVTIGSSAQNFGLQLDTGSSDLWVPLVDSDACPDSQSCLLGAFDPEKSTSFRQLGSAPDFEISYVDGSDITGIYFTDVLTMGSISIKKMQMGLAQESPSRDFGIMGIGFQSGESVAQTNPEAKYPNIINQLKNQGHIKTLAYSLWLNDLESNQGSILFGGVDTEKYHGDLTVLPIQEDSRTGDISSMTVVLSAVSLANKGGKSQYSQTNLNIPVILDCGSTDTYLPDAIVQPILTGVGAVADTNLGFVVPCNLGDDGATFSFTFGAPNGPVITVGMSEFVRPVPDAVGTDYSFNDKTPACIWGLQPAGDRPNLFGDTFIRSAYVVYDLETQQIAIAQTNFNTTKTNVVEFSNKEVPNASATVTGAAVTQTYSGIPGVVTQGGKPASGATQIGSGPPKPTFDLGKNAAPGLKAPGLKVSTIVASAVVLISLIFGSSRVWIM